MDIVAAGMAHVGGLRRIGKSGQLLHGERVDILADGDGLSGILSTKNSDNAGL